MEYLPLTGQRAADRSCLEAQQRATGLQPGDVTHYWHGWITHPLTAQEALVVNSEDDKEFFTQAERDALLTEAQAEAADWFLAFEEA
ncbi:MAG TPA: hypothetical protein VMY40_02000 [Anaerolineae bacterium]|nr:hypothetical protein [Anaerolineae bacterium]